MINTCALNKEEAATKLTIRDSRKEIVLGRWKRRAEAFIWHTHCCIVAKGGSYFKHSRWESKTMKSIPILINTS